MIKYFKKKTLSIVFLILLVFASAVSLPSVTEAAAETDGYIEIMHKISTARPMTPVRYNFRLDKASDIYFDLRTSERTTVTLTILNREDEKTLQTTTLPSSDPRWSYVEANGTYKYTYISNLAAGEYILEMNFETEVNYDLTISRIADTAKLSRSKLTLTKGFSTTLKVTGGTIKSCSSSRKSVATVTNKGKVTAKKTGTAKITVTLTDGKKLTCTVTVKANSYSASKISISDIPYNTYGMKAYSASFDSKGNLVVKFKIANNSYGKIQSVPSFKITVKDQKKTTVATYKKNSYKVTVKSYSDKSCTVKIPKSSLHGNSKSVDLRNSTITVSGDSANSSF